MEPKNPIIINGVDVSECKYITYKNSLKPRCGNTCTPCCGRKNCYYKQFARKEKENQRYEQTLIAIEDIAKDMNVECFYSDFDCEDCDMKNGCIHQGRLKILQIIREVTNE